MGFVAPKSDLGFELEEIDGILIYMRLNWALEF